MTQKKTDKYQIGASCNHVLRNAVSFTLMFYHLIFIYVLTEEWTPPIWYRSPSKKIVSPHTTTYHQPPMSQFLDPEIWSSRFSQWSVMTDQFDWHGQQKQGQCFIINGHLILVGGWALPLWKMMEWKSVGMMTFPICGKSWNSCSKAPTRIYMTITSYYIYIYMNEWYHHVFIVLSSKMAITGGPFDRFRAQKWHRLLGTSNRLTRSDKKPGDGQVVQWSNAGSSISRSWLTKKNMK